MRKYYWSIEDNRVISIDELETIRQETEPDTPLRTFIEKCSYRNNGDLEPLDMEIERERKEVSSLLDDIHTITESIADLAILATVTVEEVN